MEKAWVGVECDLELAQKDEAMTHGLMGCRAGIVFKAGEAG